MTLKKIEDLQETHKIVYVPPINYRKYSMINERNSLYGVTIDFRFLEEILTNQYLASSHLLFYCNLFRHAYQNIKIAIAQCYFFAEYMEASTKQIDNLMLDTQLFAKNYDIDHKTDQLNQKSSSELQNQITIPQNLGVNNITSNNKQWTFQITNISVVKNNPLQNKEKYNVSKLETLLTQMASQNDLKDIQSLNQQEYLFFPINQQNNHWISLIICLKEKKIRYFDSYNSHTNQDIIKAAMEILKFIGVTMPSEYTISTHYNKQDNGFDCGIFTLISLLYTYQRLPYNYNQQLVTKYRQSILYNLAIVGSQIQVNQELLEKIIQLSML
ncbi:unnamed protein product [Paramecium primaurelia]|uniref:Ubiquitin-like protease family profile domain-containing protein n=1 Tax=Paramecium primaurelia TaxID=5886 RepID=A0A8S1Q1J6_PARPR|nr:unnamed protein product [Paramecium primaurelia]